MDQTEAENIKKKWQDYTEQLYKKGLNDPDNHDGMVTHVEPDILECEVKRTLGSITTNTASGGDRILAEVFQILKDAAVKSATLSMSANLENSAVATGVEKVSCHSSPKERQCQRTFKLLYSSVQSLSRVRLFETPRTAAHQAFLSITNSQSLLKLMSIE